MLLTGVRAVVGRSTWQSSRSASTLVVGEVSGDNYASSVLNVISAAAQIGGDVDVVLTGKGAEAAAQGLGKSVSGIKKVLFNEAEHLSNGVAEELAPFLASIVKEKSYTHVLAPATSTGKSVLPRLAALLDVAPISEITKVKSEDTFVRPFYAGNALATVQSSDKVKVVTVRPTSFEPAAVGSGSAAVEQVKAADAVGLTKFVSTETTESERPELTSAKMVVSGGRALKSEENFKLIYNFADKLGAAVGASRAAVDAGYCPNDLQVGQTGKIVAPQLYWAIGISGAIQHLAGMKDSKVIVAINKDPEAPIFQVADYGLVADLFEAVPEIERLLDSK